MGEGKDYGGVRRLEYVLPRPIVVETQLGLGPGFDAKILDIKVALLYTVRCMYASLLSIMRFRYRNHHMLGRRAAEHDPGPTRQPVLGVERRIQWQG